MVPPHWVVKKKCFNLGKLAMNGSTLGGFSSLSPTLSIDGKTKSGYLMQVLNLWDGFCTMVSD